MSGQRTVLEVRGYAHLAPHGGGAAGRLPDFSVKSGECVLLCGPSGCGKTTFLLAAAGLVEPGRVSGEMRRFPSAPEQNPAPGRTGIVLQNPETQLLCATVQEEAAFGPRNMGRSAAEAKSDAMAALEAVDLAACAERSVEALSMGQKHRLALAATLALRPNLLLLDEPFTQLDPAGRERLTDIVRSVMARGGAVVVSEHVPGWLDGLATSRVDFAADDAPCACGGFPATARGEWDGDPVVAVTGLEAGYSARPEILCGVDLTVRPGRKVLVSGDNGGGKSTLLACLVGALTPRAGAVRVCGLDAPRPAALCGLVGYLGQNPEQQLFEDTVLDEVGFSLRRLGRDRAAAQEQASAVLRSVGLEHLAPDAPLALSFGQKHLVALASVLAAGPRVVLLDEPFTGLAEGVRATVLHLLDDYVRATGAAVVMVSHDPRCPGWADEHYVMRGGRCHAV